ncbi:MAG: GAF domain-containing protein [Caldilineaceae bacterium]|nr:GAF domain-containing protein [Caldilineaceae bacterium]
MLSSPQPKLLWFESPYGTHVAMDQLTSVRATAEQPVGPPLVSYEGHTSDEEGAVPVGTQESYRDLAASLRHGEAANEGVDATILRQLGQQLMATWHAPHPELSFENLLDLHLQQLYRWFPNQVALATIYIYRETGLLYLERMVGPLHDRVQTRTAHPAGAAAQLVQIRQPIFVGDTNQWPRSLPSIPDHIARNSSIRAYFSLPLLIGLADQEEVIGVIQVSLTQPQSFTPSWQAQMWHWAQQAAIVLQNARVIRRRRGEEQAFATISASAAAGDPDEVATVIAEQVHSLTKSAFVAVLGYDATTETLVTQGDPIFGHERASTRIELDLKLRSINAHVFGTGNAYYAPDVRRDPHYRVYAGWDEEMNAAFCVPLIVRNQVLGTIYMTSKLRDGIAIDDRIFIQKLAPHAAVALHLATLMAEERKQRAVQTEQVAILNKVKKFQADIVDILPVDDQMRQIRLALSALGMQTDGFTIATFDPGTEMIHLPKVRERGQSITEEQKAPGMLHGPRRLGERRDLIDYVLQTRQAVLVEDFKRWPQQAAVSVESHGGVQSCLAVPLYRSDRIIGVLALSSYDQISAYSDADRRLLEAIAGEIAIVIDNAQKYDAVLSALQQSVRELHAVSTFQQQISNIAIDDDAELRGADIVDINPAVALPSVEERELQNIYEQASIAMADVGLKTGSMYIVLYDEQTKTINLPLIYESEQMVDATSRQAYSRRRLGDYPNLIEWIIEHRQPLFFDSRREMESWGAKRGNQFRLPERSRSWIGAPMLIRNQLIGVLVLRDMEHDHAFRREHSPLLQTIAAQAAVVIDNARLYERARKAVRQLHALYQAGQSIAGAGLSLEDVLQAILQQAVRVTGGYFATLRLAHKESITGQETLDLVAVWPPNHRRQIPAALTEMPVDGPGIIPLAYRQNRYQLVADVRTSEHFVDSGTKGETRAEIAVVLRQADAVGKGTIGVLNVEHRDVGGLTKEDHAGVLVGLANLATLAIKNVEQAGELEEARDYAIVSEALAWMGIFGAETQHTMAQKLSSMRYCLDTLRAWGETLPSEEQEILLDVTTDLSKIVNDIQAIGPPESIAMVTNVPTNVDVELRQSIAQWCAEHNQHAAQPVTANFDLQCALYQINVPARVLRIATEKLVHNALKAMPDGGTLTIRSRLMGSEVTIEIADSGTGIPHFARADFLKRPIQRPPDSTAGGSGMGAHMARIVARRHQGELELVETSEGGTTLRLSFPVANGGVQ